MTAPAYPQAALAHQVHGWGANVLAIRTGTKKPAHPWKRFQSSRQTSADIDALPWGAADRVGIINGISGIRSFDIDDSTSYGPVIALLVALGLPEDYRWVEQSESGTGWHVWVVCEEEIPTGVLAQREKDPGVFFGASADGSFDHLELRWEQNQTIIASSGGVSRWLSGPPDAMPARVSVGAILNTFLRTTKRPVVPPSRPVMVATASTGGGDTKVREQIREAFDLVAFAQLRFGGETQRDPDGQVRVLGNGGLLFDLKRGVWYRFNGDVGGDCFDLVGAAIYGDAWQRNNKEMFRAAFKEAAAYAGVAIEAIRVHRGRIEHVPDEIRDASPDPAPSMERRYRLYTATEIKERPVVTFRVEGLIPEGALCALIGNPGTYKTFVALDLALCIATGTPWHGRDVAQGRVVFISAEGVAGLGQRIMAWERKHWTTVGDDHFRVITDAPQLLDGADVHTLIASISEAMDAPDGIFIDTLARTFDGEENSSQDMGAYIRALDRVRQTFGCFVCPIHHSNAAGLRARGSSAFLAALDVEMTMSKELDAVSLAVTKAKEFSEGGPIVFSPERVEVGKHVASMVLVTSDLKVSIPSADERRALAILVDVFGSEGVTQSQWEKAAIETGLSNMRFARARRILVDRGWVNGPPRGAYVRGFRYAATDEGIKVFEGFTKVSKPSAHEGIKVSRVNTRETLIPSDVRGTTEEEENPDDLF